MVNYQQSISPTLDQLYSNIASESTFNVDALIADGIDTDAAYKTQLTQERYPLIHLLATQAMAEIAHTYNIGLCSTNDGIFDSVYDQSQHNSVKLSDIVILPEDMPRLPHNQKKTTVGWELLNKAIRFKVLHEWYSRFTIARTLEKKYRFDLERLHPELFGLISKPKTANVKFQAMGSF